MNPYSGMGGGGIGSGIMGGLATGAAVGVGVVAGEALAHRFMDGSHNESNDHQIQSPDTSPIFNADVANFGIYDSAISDNSSGFDSGSAGSSWD
jgi:hypothetical protein